MSVPSRFRKHATVIQLALAAYDQRLIALCSQLRSQPRTVWTPNNDGEGRALETVVQALERTEFVDDRGDEPRDGDTEAVQAVVSVGPLTQQRVADLNMAKRILKLSFTEITNFRVTVDDERLPLALVILRELGRARLDRARLYRSVVSFDTVPSSMGFSRTRVRTVARRSVEQVFTWLSQRGDEGAEAYRNDLKNLPVDEPLALVKGRYVNQRANVCVNGEWSMVQAHLPLFIPNDRSSEPSIRSVTEPLDAQSDVQKRSDEQLCPTPLFTLGATSVYRYLSE